MQKGGTYNTRLTWLKGTRTKDEQGQDVRTHTEYGKLWCSVTESNGRDTQDYGAKQTGADCDIRVKNFPALSTDDLLQDESGTVYHIESMYAGDREWVLAAYRNDVLSTDYTIVPPAGMRGGFRGLLLLTS